MNGLLASLVLIGVTIGFTAVLTLLTGLGLYLLGRREARQLTR
jgi:hypothetical protein